jgi:hypothetical protein
MTACVWAELRRQFASSEHSSDQVLTLRALGIEIAHELAALALAVHDARAPGPAA